MQTQSDYESVPYPDFIHPPTNPNAMAAMGRLHGIQSVPPSDCRVLELGCGQGGNLISLAQLHPHSRFVGVDLSRRHIEAAKRTVAAIGLTMWRSNKATSPISRPIRVSSITS